MVLYRISACRHADKINGNGAKLYGGRWNSVGTPMHYMTTSRALAVLEVLVHKGNTAACRNFCLTTFEVPNQNIKKIRPSILPSDWKSYPSTIYLKKLGDSFIEENRFLLLKVPSAIVDGEFNYLMNVNHALTKSVKIKTIRQFNFDERLIV